MSRNFVQQSVILVPGRWKQEHQKFKVILHYTVSLRPVWVTRDPVSKKEKQTNTPGYNRNQLLSRSYRDCKSERYGVKDIHRTIGGVRLPSWSTWMAAAKDSGAVICHTRTLTLTGMGGVISRSWDTAVEIPLSQGLRLSFKRVD